MTLSVQKVSENYNWLESARIAKFHDIFFSCTHICLLSSFPNCMYAYPSVTAYGLFSYERLSKKEMTWPSSVGCKCLPLSLSPGPGVLIVGVGSL